MARPVRKRNAYTRGRAKKGRPKTPAPTTGWLIAELSQLTGLSVRALRNYVTVGIIQPLELRGTATRYPRRDFLRLLAMLRMKREGQLRLAEIKRKLDALGDAELEAWLVTQPLAPQVTAALGLTAQQPAPPSAPQTNADQNAGSPLEMWQRLRLLPGLELMLSTEASVAVRGIAQKIYADCVVARGTV